MGIEDSNLRAYFDKILEIQRQKSNRFLSEQDLRDIAQDLGLSESDWQAVEQYFADYIKRGNAYLAYQSWQEAINEFQQALTIKPTNMQALFGMATAQKGLWEDRKAKENKQFAEYYAKQCLQIEPEHSGAHAIIRDLRQENIAKSKGINPAQKTIFIVALALFALIMLVTWLVVSQSGSSKITVSTEQTSTGVNVEVQDDTQVAKPEKPAQSSNRSPAQVRQSTPGGLSVDFIQDGDYFDLEVLTSELKPFAESYSYTINGNLIPKNIEVDKAKLKVELLDAQDKVILSDFKEVIQDYEPVVRSGDRKEFNILIYREEPAPNVAKVRLAVVSLAQLPAPASYNPSPKIATGWLGVKPSNIDLEIRERSSSYRTSSLYKGKVSHDLVLEIKNVGNSNIKRMKIQVAWLDANGKTLTSKEQIVVLSSEAPLLREYTRVEYVLGQIETSSPSQIANYKVSIIEVS